MEKLHPNSLSQIYQEPLYRILDEVPLPASIAKDIAPPTAQIQGKGTNKVLIINHDASSNFIGENDKLFLNKIITATNHALEDCSLVNAQKQSLNIHDLIEQTRADKIICFNTNLFELGLKNTNPLKYELSDIGNNIMIILADSLREIDQNQEKKKALWFALKRMFNV